MTAQASDGRSRREQCDMAGEIDHERGDASYHKFYQSGGWRYSFWKEYWWHRRNVVKRFGLTRGMDMLEIASGCGFHTNLFNRMGFSCVGVDRSRQGIAWAQDNYPKREFHCCDIRNMPFERASFDVIIARGCSHYHYDLMDDLALNTTATMANFLKPNGVFIMIIVTNLSGSREPDAVWHNTLDAYRSHFSSFGLQWSVDWVDGMAISALRNTAIPKKESIGLGEATVPVSAQIIRPQSTPTTAQPTNA